MFHLFLRSFGDRLKSVHGSKGQPKPPKNAWRVRPSLCQLEDRMVPSTFLVTTTNDIYVPPVPAVAPPSVSLRYTLELVHTDANGPTDTILLPQSTTPYAIQQPYSGLPPDLLGNTLGGAFVIAPTPSVINTIIQGGVNATGTPVTGATPTNTVVNGQGFDRVFDVIPPSFTAIGSLTLQNLTVTGGAPASSMNTPPGPAAIGGGVLFDDPGAAPNQNAVNLANVVVQSNLASGGGGIATLNAGVNLSGGSLVTNNHANGAGGGIATQNGSILVDASGVNNNSASGSGGGISYLGTNNPGGNITIVGPGASVSHNSSGGSGGGISAGNLAAVSISNAQVNNNLSTGGGGGIATNAGSVLLQNASVDSNQSGGPGGGVNLAPSGSAAGNQLTVIGSDISGNRSGGSGGAVNNQNVTSMTITGNSTFNNNIAGGNGGAINNQTATTVNVQGALFNGNNAQGGSGGAIYSAVPGESVLLSVVTISNNDAGGTGGGVYETGGASFTVTGSGTTPSVFSNNEAAVSGGALFSNATVVTIQSTQFINNGTTGS